MLVYNMNSFISYKFVTKLKLFADATIKISTNKDQRTFKNKKTEHKKLPNYNMSSFISHKFVTKLKLFTRMQTSQLNFKQY